jgi:hypothetical protein
MSLSVFGVNSKNSGKGIVPKGFTRYLKTTAAGPFVALIISLAEDGAKVLEAVGRAVKKIMELSMQANGNINIQANPLTRPIPCPCFGERSRRERAGTIQVRKYKKPNTKGTYKESHKVLKKAPKL